MSFTEAIKSGFRRKFDFRGRASRSEYWYWNLFFLIFGQLLWIPAKILVIVYVIMTSASLDLSDLHPLVFFFACIHQGLQGGFVLLTAVPSAAMTVRRLHDVGASGWWVAVPIGLVVMLFWLLSDSGWRALLPIDFSLSPLYLSIFYGWWLVIVLKAISIFTLLFWSARVGTFGHNRFGEDPLKAEGLF